MRRDQRAWIMVDVGNSAFATTILAALFPVYLPSLMPAEGITLSVFGWSWQSSAMSLWGYTVSLSLLITFVLTPLLGVWADEGGNRKKALGAFTLLGVVATAGLFFFDSWKGALTCFVFANIGFSASNIFYNSLLSSVAEEKEWHSLSLKGFAWGYIGGGLLLLLNLILVMKYDWFGLPSKKSGVECSFLMVSVWWMAFTLPALFQIQESVVAKSGDSLSGALHHLRALYRTLKSVLTTRNLLIFMISFALFNDGISTVISMASIFGKQALNLPEETLIGTLLVIQFLGLPFTLVMTKVSDRWGAKNTLMGALVFWLGIIAYAYFMQSSADFWLLGVLVAVVLGVSQALPRSIFAQLVPKDRQAEYFSFFALSGKMTSILGPTLFGAVRDATGNDRLSVVALGVLFVLGLIGLSFVWTPKSSSR